MRLLPVLPFLLVSSAFASEPFTPDDPYFFPNDTTGYYGQWHLDNQMPLSGQNAGYDVNIRGAWARGLTGAGVIIGVLDAGVETTHADLRFQQDGSLKFLNDYSWGFDRTVAENRASTARGDIPDGAGLTSMAHGSASAGAAAATGGNGIGVTGGAPRAFIASLQLDSYDLSDGYDRATMMAAGLLYQGQTSGGLADPYAQVDWGGFGPSGPPVKIKTMSMGGPYAFMENGAFGKSAIIAEAIAESSRNGVIHLLAAGNSRDRSSNEDAGKGFITSLPRVITVTAMGSHGKLTSYGNFGANIFVSAPSGHHYEEGYFNIATADTTGQTGYNPNVTEAYLSNDLAYTSRFGGTSAATPIAAGVIALGVEANPLMDARMAQHLLVRTSRLIDPQNTLGSDRTGGWITNQAGFHFNANYGFGLIDADAFTQRAAQVASMSDEVIYQSNATAPPVQEFSLEDATLSFTQTMAETEPLPVEYVRVSLTISGLQADVAGYEQGVGSIAGDFSAVLESAQGTRYTLFLNDNNLPLQDRAWRTILTDDEYDERQPIDYLEWSFISYAYWGEALNGDWTISITNHGHLGTGLNGLWESVSFEFGTGEIAFIPEPSTWLLMSLSGLAWAAWHRRRARC